MSLTVRHHSCAYLSNSSEIRFQVNGESGLSVTIDTQRLHMRPVESTEEEYDRYALLLEGIDRGEIRRRIDTIWANLWREQDAFSCFSVFTKEREFIGSVALEHGDLPGVAKLSFLFQQSHAGNGYEAEAVGAIVKEYAPITAEESYKIEGNPLELIEATASPDSPDSYHIFESIGMKPIKEDSSSGPALLRYAIRI